MKSIKKTQWEASYRRKENYIFYPKEEVVKFLNRFVIKKLGLNDYQYILTPHSNKKVIIGLDFGCGIGAQTILMHEFGIEAYGLDISEEAINTAKNLAATKGYKDLINRFLVYDGKKISFPDNYFDICISESVLDSMPFSLAKELIKEIDRCTSQLAFISLISGDNDKFYREYDGDEIVKDKHEHGTIQSYYNYNKILNLISGTKFSIKWIRLIQEIGINHRYLYGRYYIVLEKQR